MLLRIRTVWWLALAIFLTNSTCFAGQTNNAATRPANWAALLHERGLSNLYEVTTNLYRGRAADCASQAAQVPKERVVLSGNRG